MLKGTKTYLSNPEQSYFAPLKSEGKDLSEEKKERYFNILSRTAYLSTLTFALDLKNIKECIADPETPSGIKLVLGEWLYRRIKLYYRPRLPEIKEVTPYITVAIQNSSNIVLKGLYIHYHNIEALREIAKFFFTNRYPSEYFILQMLNDVQLIQTTPREKMLTHFLKWVDESKDFEQRSNLLDVLLREFPKDLRVVKLHQEMKFEDKTSVTDAQNIYTNQQNAHENDITSGTIDAGRALLSWYKDNSYNFEPPVGVVFEEKDIVDEAMKDLTGVAHLENVVIRAKIDNTSWGKGFTIMSILIALARYVSLSPSKEELLVRCSEEFADTAGLCSSAYITRCLNVLQGYDERFTVTISFAKQLHAVLTYHLAKGFQHANNEQVNGSYDEEFKKEYLDYTQKIVNDILPKLFKQYTQVDVEKNLLEVMTEITDYKDWKYEDGKLKNDHQSKIIYKKVVNCYPLYVDQESSYQSDDE